MAPDETYQDYIEDDVEYMNKSDWLTLLILKYRKSRATRLHKVALILNSVLEGKTPSSHGPHFFGGFSDDLESSLSRLAESGIIKKVGSEYMLTKYGEKVLGYLERNPPDEFEKLKIIASKLLPSLNELSDEDIVDLTYLLFPELTTNSVIREKVARRLKRKIGKLGVRLYIFEKTGNSDV